MLDVIGRRYLARVPTLFWGPPGIGKTAVLERFAQDRGLPLVVPTIRAPEDIAVPIRVNRDGVVGVQMVPVDDFLTAAAWREGIVFIDEVNTMSPECQAAALRFIDSGSVGGVRISPRIWRCGAANPIELATDGHELAPPVANRMVHTEWRVDLSDFVLGFPSYWGAPPDIGVPEHTWAPARAQIAAFLRARGDVTLLINPAAPPVVSWPSPRSWDFASRLLAVGDMAGIADAVGEGAAREFLAWLGEMDLPDPGQFFAGVDFRPTGRADRDYAILSAIATHFAVDPNRQDRFVELVLQAYDAGLADIVLAVLQQYGRLVDLRRVDRARFEPLLDAFRGVS